MGLFPSLSLFLPNPSNTATAERTCSAKFRRDSGQCYRHKPRRKEPPEKGKTQKNTTRAIALRRTSYFLEMNDHHVRRATRGLIHTIRISRSCLLITEGRSCCIRHRLRRRHYSIQEFCISPSFVEKKRKRKEKKPWLGQLPSLITPNFQISSARNGIGPTRYGPPRTSVAANTPILRPNRVFSRTPPCSHPWRLSSRVLG